ncbi:MAG TPA: alanine dehydrogenase, partial [Desulfobacteraceae bacterium]|nr:alanine dehydrogenase [Desulfobacteraceae bacterium]
MRIGVLKEIKTKEHRIAVTPEGVEQMRNHGHEVLVEIDAGNGSYFYNEDYENAGAKMCTSPEEIYQKSEMIMKVKEPLPVEYPLIQNGQILFT